VFTGTSDNYRSGEDGADFDDDEELD
jgi:hypothetical protein